MTYGESDKSDAQSTNTDATVVDLEDLEANGVPDEKGKKCFEQDSKIYPVASPKLLKGQTPAEPAPPTPPPLKPAPSKLNIFGFILLETRSGIQQQMKEDKRFHPIIIGGILFIFLLAVSVFISHMENIGYFDSFYACFITYSTIGFGDIDIFVSKN